MDTIFCDTKVKTMGSIDALHQIVARALKLTIFFEEPEVAFPCHFGFGNILGEVGKLGDGIVPQFAS